MNEEELKNKIEECDKLIITYGKREDWDRLFSTERVKGSFQAELRGFQKGKLEQKKEELKFLREVDKLYKHFDENIKLIQDRIKQLSKEIGGKEEKEGEDEHRI